jgi:DNA-binding NarL/FixJ family response regulator
MYIHNSIQGKNKMIKVLIADDHPVVCQAVSTLLKVNSTIKMVGEAYDGEAAVQMAKELHPHIVLLDLDLPKINGLKVANLILKQDPSIRVIAFTSYSGHYLIHAALREKFSGYLTKASAVKEVVKAIKSVYSGEHYFAEMIVDKISDEKFPFDKLSEKEYEIFNLLVKNHNLKAIVSTLKMTLNTLRSHEKSIYKKLKVKNNKELILFAIKAGFFELN